MIRSFKNTCVAGILIIYTEVIVGLRVQPGLFYKSPAFIRVAVSVNCSSFLSVAFSHDVTAAILVFQDNETAAMLVFQHVGA